MDRAEFEVLCRASDGYVEQLLKLVLPTRAERSLEPLAEGGYAHGVLKLSPGGILASIALTFRRSSVSYDARAKPDAR